MMRIVRMVDLSQEIYHNCPVLPQFDPPKLDYILIGPRDGWNLERLTLNLHTATHMDAPAHMADFRTTLDQIPVDQFQGSMVYIPLTHKQANEAITVADLQPYEERFGPEAIVILYTGWGEKRSWTKEFIFGSPFLSNEAAAYLVDKRIRGIGIDHFSIGGTGEENDETHRILLGSGIWIAEGLQLNDPALSNGEWQIMALPLKIRESSGAPARIVALQWKEDDK